MNFMPPLRGARRRGSSLWRTLALGTLGLVAIVVLAGWAYLRLTSLEAPAIANRTAASTQAHGGRVSIATPSGESTLERRGGLWVLHLRGEPYDLGYAQ